MVAGDLLKELELYNRERRQSQASAERQFVEARSQEALMALRKAEGQLRAFSEENRATTNSPALRLEEARLEREISQRQQVYTGLLQAYETARVDEVRDTPILTLVEQPRTPARAESRRALVFGLVAAIAFASIWLAWLVIAERVRAMEARGLETDRRTLEVLRSTIGMRIYERLRAA